MQKPGLHRELVCPGCRCQSILGVAFSPWVSYVQIHATFPLYLGELSLVRLLEALPMLLQCTAVLSSTISHGFCLVGQKVYRSSFGLRPVRGRGGTRGSIMKSARDCRPQMARTQPTQRISQFWDLELLLLMISRNLWMIFADGHAAVDDLSRRHFRGPLC